MEARRDVCKYGFVRLRFARWRVAAKIAGLLIQEAFFSGGAAFWLLYALPWFLLYEWYFGGGITLGPIVAYLAVVAIAVVWRLASSGEDVESDSPLPVDWARYPDLAALGAVRKRPGYIALSPALWRNFGCDPSRLAESQSAVTLPLGCLSLWSILDLRCHLTHATVRGRLPRWLLHPATHTLSSLEATHYQDAMHGIANWRTRNVQRIGMALGNKLVEWRLIADLEADRRLARSFGPNVVADWIERSALAELTVPACLAAVVEPAARRGQLLPIAESCPACQRF